MYRAARYLRTVLSLPGTVRPPGRGRSGDGPPEVGGKAAYLLGSARVRCIFKRALDAAVLPFHSG